MRFKFLTRQTMEKNLSRADSKKRVDGHHRRSIPRTLIEAMLVNIRRIQYDERRAREEGNYAQQTKNHHDEQYL